jgi:hypothetical protein
MNTLQSTTCCTTAINYTLRGIAGTTLLISTIAFALLFTAAVPLAIVLPIAIVSAIVCIASIALIIARWRKLKESENTRPRPPLVVISPPISPQPQPSSPPLIAISAAPSSMTRTKFLLPARKPAKASKDDWAALSTLSLDKELQEAQDAMTNSEIDTDYIKISRTTHSALDYSYLLSKDGKLFRCTHKKSKNGSAKEDAIGNGSYKKAYHSYDENNEPTLVRAVVLDIAQFNRETNGLVASKQYGKDPRLLAGSPHLYTNARGVEKLVFYTPKKLCLNDLVVMSPEGTYKMDLTLDQMISVLRQLIELIAKIHNEGGAHRDIKLENLFISKHPTNGKVTLYILDFDFYTRTQAALSGSPAFVPPELWGAHRCSFQECQESDTFALGLVALALCGRVPDHDKLVEFSNTLDFLDSSSSRAQWEIKIQEFANAFEEEYRKKPAPSAENYITFRYLPLIVALLSRNPQYKTIDQVQRLFEKLSS